MSAVKIDDDRNRCSPSVGISVHVRPDWAFTMGRNTHICEDLARQDPVAELVRCVGPNLVIAILMDGPQLAERWSARYATVLAEDPGCSVLTLTSLGMVQLCRMAGKPPSRRIALWKDPKSGAVREIELPDGAVGIVLALAIEYEEEWTADGRSDHEQTAVVVLGGVYPVNQVSGTGLSPIL